MRLPERAKTETVTVLVVDGDSHVRKFCEDCLSRNGFSVLQGDDGLEAVLIAASHRKPIDILITEVELPRMRGTELGEVFKLLWPRTRVLYVSGPSDASIYSELEPDAMFLPKPFAPEALVESVGKMLSACGVLEVCQGRAQDHHSMDVSGVCGTT
jgi:DNA-binding NtrC family response regulator